MNFRFLFMVPFLLVLVSNARSETRWSITDDGGIVWNVKPGETHEDNIEMSGKKVSVIVTYGVTNGALALSEIRHFPDVPHRAPKHAQSHLGAFQVRTAHPDQSRPAG